MTFVVDGTNGLTFNDATTQSSTATNASNISSGTLGKARLPTGSVLQVVNGTYGTLVSSGTATYIDTGLTATITPTSASSKILVLVAQNGVSKTASGTASVGLILLRGSTTINGIALSWGYGLSSRIDDNTLSTCYLDSPATTSATTYKTQFRNNDGGGTVYMQYNGTNSLSTITLMEISA
jgi:hypothetical protein